MPVSVCGPPTSKAKPAGVRGCQVWVKIGTAPPASASDLQDLATDTRTSYVAGFQYRKNLNF